MAALVLDTVNTVMNTARVRLNDALDTILPLSGGILDTNLDFTQQVVNTAWREMQEELANLGYVETKDETIVGNLPIVANLDPAAQVSIGWDGFYNGTRMLPGPVLPTDMIQPLKLWERWTGQNAVFGLMENIIDGLPTFQKVAANRFWEWRSNRIYMPGALAATDIRMRYLKALGDFADTTDGAGTTIRWFNQTVPIARCLNAFAWYIVAEFVSSRAQGRPELADVALGFETKGKEAARLIFNRDVQAKQRVDLRRIPRSGRTQNFGYDYC